MASRTDAKNQQVVYTYDNYARLTKVQRYPVANGAEDLCQQENYTYGTVSDSTYVLGRLQTVQYKGGYNSLVSPTCDTTFTESYTYTQPGGVATKTLATSRTFTNSSGGQSNQSVNLVASFTYDNEGRMLTEQYPNANRTTAGPNLSFTYDSIPMTRLLVLFCWLMISLRLDAAAEFCSLRVSVRATANELPISTPIAVVDPAGRTIATMDSVSGEARFCDLPFGEYSIIVGDNERCGQTVIRGVRIGFGDERVLKAMANGCPHPWFPGIVQRNGRWYPTTCGILIRVRGSDGMALPGAEIDLSGGKLLSDSFGRIRIHMKANEELVLSLTRPRYVTETVPLTCGRTYSESEKTIIMHRSD